MIDRRLLLNDKVSPKFRHKICKTLNEGAQGMFRWVALSLQRLQAIKFLPDFKVALGKLPSQLSDLYDIIYAEIDNTDAFGRSAAISALTLLLCSQRLLSIEELIAAIYIQSFNELQPSLHSDNNSESDEGTFSDAESESDMVSPGQVLQLCRNLVVLDSESEVFRFAHPSVREYLVKRPGYTSVEQHALATKICLAVYLTKDAPSREDARGIEKNTLDRLRSYSKIYWPLHYKYVDDSILLQQRDLVRQVIIEDAQSAALQFLLDDMQNYGVWVKDLNEEDMHAQELNKVLGLHWADYLGHGLLSAAESPPLPLNAICAFGLSAVLTEVPILQLTSWIQSQLGRESVSLSLAVENGHEGVVRLLLARDNVAADFQDEYQRTPLSYAAEEGHESVVRILLAHGDVAINSQGVDKYTPLDLAAKGGHEGVVRLLKSRLRAESD